MNNNSTVFAQLISFLPKREFARIVEKYSGNKGVKGFTCWEQYLCMVFGQLTYRESLRDTVTCLESFGSGLYHCGIKSRVARSTISNANLRRDWRIYEEFALLLIKRARKLYANDKLEIELKETAYALDASTIDLCFNLFPWAKFRETKAGIKLNTVMELGSNIPVIIDISDAKPADINFLDRLRIEAGAIYIMDRGYFDFERLYRFVLNLAWFVVRAKRGFKFHVIESRDIDKDTGLRADQTIILATKQSKENYPDRLRRVTFYDQENKKHLVFLTNNFSLPALTIAKLYKSRWHIELFFKWIKQHLRIKKFYGNSLNAVKTQIWIAISAYVLVAIMKKELNLKFSLYTILQVLSINLFTKNPILAVFSEGSYKEDTDSASNQLNLFSI